MSTAQTSGKPVLDQTNMDINIGNVDVDTTNLPPLWYAQLGPYLIVSSLLLPLLSFPSRKIQLIEKNSLTFYQNIHCPM